MNIAILKNFAGAVTIVMNPVRAERSYKPIVAFKKEP